MKLSLLRLSLIAAAAVAVTAAPQMAADAAGPFDGKWQLEVAAVGGGGAQVPDRCPALRLRLEIKDNKLHGRLEQNPFNVKDVQTAEGRQGSPVSGTVQPDGTLSAQWESIKATGKLNGNSGEMHWTGGCGPRSGTITRVG